MAQRRVYAVGKGIPVNTRAFEFIWESGMSIQQRRRSAQNLQRKFHQSYDYELMEISTAAPENSLGYKLSAFNLIARLNGIDKDSTVEKLYQGSKIVQTQDGILSMQDLYFCESSMQAKKDPRWKNSKLIGFQLADTQYPITPKTAFYNWLYINNLYKFNRPLFDELISKNCIFFCDTQAKLTVDACQAEACTLLMYLIKHNVDFTKFENIAKAMSVCEQHNYLRN